MDHTAKGIVKAHFEAICKIGERPVGSEGGKRAEAYVESILRGANFETARAEYRCTDWRPLSCALVRRRGPAATGGQPLRATANPYSPSVRAAGRAVRVSSLGELESRTAGREVAGTVLVLGPELCGFPITPKAFDFYNPEEHRRLVASLEEGRPAAVVAVSPHDEGIWPVFADPDLGIPSVTVPFSEASRVAEGTELELSLEGSSRPSKGATVSGVLRLGAPGSRRRLLCAHLDTKHYSPGALDNGGGVATVLAAAQLAAGRSAAARAARSGAADLEVVLFMGEECNAYGEKAWLAARGGSVADISLAVNVDGAGGGPNPTDLSFFNFPDEARAAILEGAGRIGHFEEAAPWYESDHYLFWPAGIPTIAATSGDPHRYDRLIHGPGDRAELVDIGLLAELAELCSALSLSAKGYRG
jgi:aminopeptidase YwaD